MINKEEMLGQPAQMDMLEVGPDDRVAMDQEPVFFRDLMSAIGYFLLNWSRLEQDLSAEILRRRSAHGEVTPRVRGELRARLTEWQGLLTHSGNTADTATARQIIYLILDGRWQRNLLVRGLCAGDAQPTKDEPPYILCLLGGYEDPAKGTKRYTLDELTTLAQRADEYRLAIQFPQQWRERRA